MEPDGEGGLRLRELRLGGPANSFWPENLKN